MPHCVGRSAETVHVLHYTVPELAVPYLPYPRTWSSAEIGWALWSLAAFVWMQPPRLSRHPKSLANSPPSSFNSVGNVDMRNEALAIGSVPIGIVAKSGDLA